MATGDVVNIVLPATTNDYFLTVTDANGVDAPGNMPPFGDFIVLDDFEPLSLTLSFDPDPLELSLIHI